MISGRVFKGVKDGFSTANPDLARIRAALLNFMHFNASYGAVQSSILKETASDTTQIMNRHSS